MATDNQSIICVDDEKDIVQAYFDFLSPAPVSAPRRSSRSVPTASSTTVTETPYTIFKAYSGEEALEIVKKELKEGRHIAGGFFDVKMEGGMDGIKTIQEIWKLDPDMNTTIVTAYQDRNVQDINEIFGPRFKDQWDYMNKPFSSGEILQKARQMTAAWNRRKNLQDTLDMLKETQAKLIESERMAAIGQVARGVGHEFGNILQQIVGNADIALGFSDPSELKKGFEIILQASERAAIIVRNLQSFSKKKKEERMPVDVGRIIEDTLALMNHKFKKSIVKISDERKPVGQIIANSVEIQQVLVNLIINAIHAMEPAGGKLAIGCDQKNGLVEIQVSDSGCGIDPDVLPRIFEYAFTTKGESGSGLGLSISKEIIEKHGGTISVQSTEGSGTTFKITLPMVK